MLEERHGPRFAPESRARFGIVSIFESQGLERNLPPGAQVAAKVDQRHSTLTEEMIKLDDVVTGDDLL
jgi:hypothetical protein